jgi:hypothetical protein
MTGKSPTRGDYGNLGGRFIGGKKTVFLVGIFSSFEELGFGVLVNHCTGH